MQLVRGANALLADQRSVKVIIGATAPPRSIDFACFLVDATGKVPEPRGFVCPDEIYGPNKAVHYSSDGNAATFSIDLAELPTTIMKCVFTATVLTGTFRQVHGLRATVRSSGEDILYEHADAGDERTLLVTEVYRHASGWKFRAVGQGFTGDDRPLAAFFGAALPQKVAPPDMPRTSASEPPAIEIVRHTNATPPPITNATPPPIQLGKIVLDKPQASAPLSLSKTGVGPLNIRVKMTWHAGVDLDLHAFYRLKDGSTGHVYFADKGSLNDSPWIALDQDSAVDRRSGDHEENLTIARIDAVHSILFATNIFTLGGLFGFGSDNFARYDGVVTVSTGDQVIVVPLASSEPGRWAVIARLDNATQPRVTRIDRVVKNTPTLADFPGDT